MIRYGCKPERYSQYPPGVKNVGCIYLLRKSNSSLVPFVEFSNVHNSGRNSDIIQSNHPYKIA